jgi:hypothetical protein
MSSHDCHVYVFITKGNYHDAHFNLSDCWLTFKKHNEFVYFICWQKKKMKWMELTALFDELSWFLWENFEIHNLFSIFRHFLLISKKISKVFSIFFNFPQESDNVFLSFFNVFSKFHQFIRVFVNVYYWNLSIL